MTLPSQTSSFRQFSTTHDGKRFQEPITLDQNKCDCETNDTCITQVETIRESDLNDQYFSWNADISKFPTLLKIDKNLAEIPAFIAAHALNQPDAPASKQPF